MMRRDQLLLGTFCLLVTAIAVDHTVRFVRGRPSLLALAREGWWVRFDPPPASAMPAGSYRVVSSYYSERGHVLGIRWRYRNDGKSDVMLSKPDGASVETDNRCSMAMGSTGSTLPRMVAAGVESPVVETRYELCPGARDFTWSLAVCRNVETWMSWLPEQRQRSSIRLPLAPEPLPHRVAPPPVCQ